LTDIFGDKRSMNLIPLKDFIEFNVFVIYYCVEGGGALMPQFLLALLPVT
jgi:hypothetical protein